MAFDVGDLFGNLFGGTVPTTATVAQSVALPEPIPRPEATELPTPAVDPEAANVDEVPDFDSLPLPGEPCPVCGSLEEWTDLLGRQRCGVCEADTLDKALPLVEQAARLREQARKREPAHQDNARGVPTVSVDTQDLGDKRPTQRRLRGLCGV